MGERQGLRLLLSSQTPGMKLILDRQKTPTRTNVWLSTLGTLEKRKQTNQFQQTSAWCICMRGTSFAVLHYLLHQRSTPNIGTYSLFVMSLQNQDLTICEAVNCVLTAPRDYIFPKNEIEELASYVLHAATSFSHAVDCQNLSISGNNNSSEIYGRASKLSMSVAIAHTK